LMAIQAGHDLLELSENSGRAIELIIQAVSDGRLSEADLNSRVKRVLAAKMWLGLDRSSQAQVAIPRLHAELNRPSSQALLRQLAEHAVTLLNSDSPIRQFNSGKR